MNKNYSFNPNNFKKESRVWYIKYKDENKLVKNAIIVSIDHSGQSYFIQFQDGKTINTIDDYLTDKIVHLYDFLLINKQKLLEKISLENNKIIKYIDKLIDHILHICQLKIEKPKSSFTFFAMYEQKRYKQNDLLLLPEIFVHNVKESWKNLSAREKKFYERLAEKDRINYYHIIREELNNIENNLEIFERISSLFS
jgi:hypothetical protein